MKNESIKCSVSNCKYYKDNMCTAAQIEVNVDNGGTQAATETQTMCHTFEQMS